MAAIIMHILCSPSLSISISHTKASFRCSSCNSLITTPYAWICDAHNVTLCNSCTTDNDHRLSAYWEPSQAIRSALSRAEFQQLAQTHIAALVPDFAARRVLFEIYRTAYCVPMHARMQWPGYSNRQYMRGVRLTHTKPHLSLSLLKHAFDSLCPCRLSGTCYVLSRTLRSDIALRATASGSEA